MNTQESSSEFLTVAEAAHLLNLSVCTVRRRIWSGELDVIRVGTGPQAPIRIATGDLSDFLERANHG
jgi:excisionase family DNA binding protein